MKRHHKTEFPLLGLALPIGISFYTFQTLSYTIDVYRELDENVDDEDIYLDEKEDTFVLRSLRFGTYDEICVYSDKIKYVSDDGRTERTLCEYNNFVDLLNNI